MKNILFATDEVPLRMESNGRPLNSNIIDWILIFFGWRFRCIYSLNANINIHLFMPIFPQWVACWLPLSVCSLSGSRTQRSLLCASVLSSTASSTALSTLSTSRHSSCIQPTWGMSSFLHAWWKFMYLKKYDFRFLQINSIWLSIMPWPNSRHSW